MLYLKQKQLRNTSIHEKLSSTNQKYRKNNICFSFNGEKIFRNYEGILHLKIQGKMGGGGGQRRPTQRQRRLYCGHKNYTQDLSFRQISFYYLSCCIAKHTCSLDQIFQVIYISTWDRSNHYIEKKQRIPTVRN